MRRGLPSLPHLCSPRPHSQALTLNEFTALLKVSISSHPFSLSKIYRMDRSIFAIVLTVLASVISLSSPLPSASIYDVLCSHGLPTGLFPKGITNFTVDLTTGRFQVQLNESCNAKFETDVHYDWNVSGTLRHGEIGEMSGVSTQDLFLWFPVKGIRVDVPSTGIVYFDVGVVRKQFSLSLFETPPECIAGDPVSPQADLEMVSDRSIAQNQALQFGSEVDRGTLRSVS